MSGSVSLINGHIDPDKKGITPQQAIKYFEDEIFMLENAPNLNGCEMTDEWREQLEICKMAKQALEKQIPKKVRMTNELYPMGICPCCENEFIPNTGFEHCHYCGQALDWSDTE